MIISSRLLPVLASVAAGTLGWLSPAAAQYQENHNYTVNAAIPDGDLSGLALSQNINTVITSILSVEVRLTITGGFNGDYYAYLVHDTPGGSGFSILLNRVGRDGGNPFGYADAGMTVTFAGSAINDIHEYHNTLNPGGAALPASTWLPDGRNVSPFTVTTADAPSAFLSSFNGLDANGTWTLYIADVAPLGQGTIVSWGLTLYSIPEPGTTVAGLLAASSLAWWRRRRS